MGGARAGQPDAQGLWEHEKAQGHRVGNLPRVCPPHGTQGPREGVLWGLSLIPGNGLEGSHSLSAQKPKWILGAPPPASLPRWVPVIFDGTEGLADDLPEPNIVQGKAHFPPSHSLPHSGHSSLLRHYGGVQLKAEMLHVFAH